MIMIINTFGALFFTYIIYVILDDIYKQSVNEMS